MLNWRRAQRILYIGQTGRWVSTAIRRFTTPSTSGSCHQYRYARRRTPYKFSTTRCLPDLPGHVICSTVMTQLFGTDRTAVSGVGYIAIFQALFCSVLRPGKRQDTYRTAVLALLRHTPHLYPYKQIALKLEPINKWCAIIINNRLCFAFIACV